MNVLRQNWENRYLIGIKEIDRQHAQVTALISALHQSIKNGGGPEVAEVILKNLINCTVDHFTYEEELLHKHGYAELEDHVQEHQDYIEQSRRLGDLFHHENIEEIGAEIGRLYSLWTDKHILGADLQYLEHLKSKGVL